MPQNNSFAKKIVTFLETNKFFRIVIGIFILESAWIALSSKYPMAFDEDYHLGIIKLYAHHPSPFWGSQPANSNVYGAVFRDPSYLYNWLMSWPYRLIGLFIKSNSGQVVAMRFMNIGLFASALYAYRRLLFAMGTSKALAQSLILLFIFIPVVPLLAGQINYDNLFILCTGLIMLWTVNLLQDLRLTKKINARKLIEIIILGLFSSIVKYAFLPFFVGAVILIAVAIIRSYKAKFPKLFKDFWSSYKGLRGYQKYLLVVLLIVSFCLCFERYGINYIRYGDIVPDCSTALSVKECSNYGPWARDYSLAQQGGVTHAGLIHYFAQDWLYGMWFRLFFAVAGPTSDFETKGPLTLPAISFIVMAIVGTLAALLSARMLLKKYGLRIVAPVFLALFYVLVLFADCWSSYKKTGQPVAINGRYLLPVLLPLMAVGAIALSKLLRRHDKAKITLLTAALLCMVWGGGTLTFILRSQDAWYWNSGIVRNMNDKTRAAIGPLVPGYKSPNQWLR